MSSKEQNRFEDHRLGLIFENCRIEPSVKRAKGGRPGVTAPACAGDQPGLQKNLTRSRYVSEMKKISGCGLRGKVNRPLPQVPERAAERAVGFSG